MTRIVLPGGSGYLGGHLARRLVARGDDVVVLTRGPARLVDGVRHVSWDGRTVGAWASEVDGADAVVHLAGKRVDCRPTRTNVAALVSSRVEPVRAVGAAVASCDAPPGVWVQLSTLAVHGDSGDTLIDDDTPAPTVGPPQMTGVARAWEAAFHEAAPDVPRRVLVRAGIALGGDDDPATARLLQLARLGLGGSVGGGEQWVSWLALDDLLRILVRAVDDGTMSGTYLATSPEPVTNAEMMAAYRRLAGRSVGLPSPAWVTRIGAWLLGSDPALALTSRRAVPTRLLAEGFEFGTTAFEEAARRAVDASAVTR